MGETIKRLKVNIILSALVCAALGVVLLVWPAQTLDIFCKILAVGLIVIGAVQLTGYFMNRSLHPFAAPLGVIVLLVGIWIFIRPESIVSLVPIVIGVMLCVHGVQDLRLALETKNNGYDRWWGMIIVAVISLAFGVLCIVNAFGLVTLALQFIGVALIYDGISDLWVAFRAVQTAKAFRREAEEFRREASAVDVEYREVEDEDEE